MSSLEIGQLSRLPYHKLADAHVGYVKDDAGKTLAKETIIKYTPSQAYVIFQEIDKSVAGKDIQVKCDDQLHLKLITIDDNKPDRRLLPLAQQFHSVAESRFAECHLVDNLATHSLGRFNLELKKNVTMDSFDLIDEWRDDAGFIVSDRHVFHQMTFKTDRLLKSLIKSSDSIVEYKKDDYDGVCDFDNTVCGFSRDAFLELLLADSNTLLAKSSGSVNGFIVGNGEKINAIYAETIEIAHSLIRAYIEKYKLKQVTFFAPAGVWELKPDSSRQVHRRHTRAVPSSIKWPKVYALNMGSHIV